MSFDKVPNQVARGNSSLVIGIVSGFGVCLSALALMEFLFPFALLCIVTVGGLSFVGTILGVESLARKEPERGKAVTGLVLNSIILLLAILLFVFVIWFFISYVLSPARG